MSRWVARIKSARITSVEAASEAEARARVYDALSKPGRYDVRRQWERAGSVVELDSDEQAMRDNARPPDSKPASADPFERLFR